MFSFSQEMRSDQAALIPQASGRGRGLSGAGSIPPEDLQRVAPKFRRGWGTLGRQTFSQFLPVFPRILDPFSSEPPTPKAHTFRHPSVQGLELPPCWRWWGAGNEGLGI